MIFTFRLSFDDSVVSSGIRMYVINND